MYTEEVIQPKLKHVHICYFIMHNECYLRIIVLNFLLLNVQYTLNTNILFIIVQDCFKKLL